MTETPQTGPAASGLEDPAAPETGPAATSPEDPGAPEQPAVQTPPPARHRPGKRLLIALFAVCGAAAVTTAAVSAVLLAQHSRRSHVASHPARATVFGLRPGQCFNSLPNGIAGIHVIPCAKPHDAEIYGAFSVAGHGWPGSVTLGNRARLGCQGRLTGYLNPQLATTGLAETYAYPNAGPGRRASARSSARYAGPGANSPARSAPRAADGTCCWRQAEPAVPIVPRACTSPGNG